MAHKQVFEHVSVCTGANTGAVFGMLVAAGEDAGGWERCVGARSHTSVLDACGRGQTRRTLRVRPNTNTSRAEVFLNLWYEFSLLLLRVCPLKRL